MWVASGELAIAARVAQTDRRHAGAVEAQAERAHAGCQPIACGIQAEAALVEAGGRVFFDEFLVARDHPPPCAIDHENSEFLRLVVRDG